MTKDIGFCTALFHNPSLINSGSIANAEVAVDQFTFLASVSKLKNRAKEAVNITKIASLVGMLERRNKSITADIGPMRARRVVTMGKVARTVKSEYWVIAESHYEATDYWNLGTC